MLEHLLAAACRTDGNQPPPGAVGSLYAHPLVETVLGGSLHPGGKALTRQLIERSELAVGARILDVGCGRGTSSRILAEAGMNVLGVDVSEATILEARQRSKNPPGPRDTNQAPRYGHTSTHNDHTSHGHTQSPNHDTSHGHAPASVPPRFQVLPHGDLSKLDETGFDAILSECTLCLQGPRQTLRHMHQLLRPGGKLLLSDVTVEAPAASFRSAAGFVACLGGALPNAELVAEVEAAGFALEWVVHRPEWVGAVRDRIRSRINVEAVLEALGEDAADLARLVQETEAAYEAGHLGYTALVASKSTH